MRSFIASLRTIILMVMLLVVVGLACNAPGESPTSTPSVTHTASATVVQIQPTLGAPETLPPILSSATAEALTQTPLPTFTPIQPPTLAATLTPSKTPTRRPSTNSGGSSTSTPKPTGTSDETAGPLTFDYHIEWRLKDASTKESIATVTITARGGGGGYTYYRDELPVEGPIFEYVWASCRGNPGSFRVTSADGQTLKVDYFANPPCPTWTPNP